MDTIYSVMEKLSSRLEGVKDEREMLIRLLISLAVLVVFIVFRNKITQLFTYVIGKTFFRKSAKACKAVNNSLKKPFSYFICVLGAYISTEIAVPAGEIRSKTLVLLKLCFILLTAWFGINMINSDYSVLMHGDASKSKKTAVKFINNVLKFLIAGIASLLVLEQFGISASRIFAALGIGGVAVAFACKDMVENMLSGFIIIYDKPFEVDDFIEVNGDLGTVKDVKIRTTRLVGVDGCEKIYPNTTMANAAITNWTRMKKRAFDETIWINYNHSADEINTFCSGIKELVCKNENVIADDVRVNFKEYGTHALEIGVFFYVNAVAAPDYLKVKTEINSAIKAYADSTGIELAFESKTLYFGNELNIKN